MASRKDYLDFILEQTAGIELAKTNPDFAEFCDLVRELSEAK